MLTNPCDHALQLSTVDRRTESQREATSARVQTLVAAYQGYVEAGRNEAGLTVR